MGCQIMTGKHSINFSDGAWLAAEMCSPWFDQERDTDSDGYQQVQVAASSIKAADSEVPNTVSEYIEWRAAKGIIPFARRNELGQAEFNAVRAFIRDVAADGDDAWLSY